MKIPLLAFQFAQIRIVRFATPRMNALSVKKGIRQGKEVYVAKVSAPFALKYSVTK